MRWAQGRLDEEVDSLRELATGPLGLPGLCGLYALALHAAGSTAQARALVNEHCTATQVSSWPHDSLFLSSTVQWAELVDVLEHHEAAHALHSAAAPFRGRVAFTGGAVFGPVSHALGMLERTLGHDEEAAASFAEASALATAMPAPLFARRVIDARQEQTGPA